MQLLDAQGTPSAISVSTLAQYLKELLDTNDPRQLLGIQAPGQLSGGSKFKEF